MTLRMQGEITMDAAQAKAELQATGKAADGAKDEITKLGKAGSIGADWIRKVGDKARSTGQRLGAAARAMAGYARGLRNMSSANRLAAGSMGNLVAQGNDVITMLAAGQNPIQLALQQGTQITQVIGPLGAAGAVRALGGAFLSMLSPINLVTIGSIAAGAALVNWLRGGEEELISFTDRMEGVVDIIDRANESFDLATGSRQEIADKFGSDAVDLVQGLLSEAIESDQRKLSRELTDFFNAMLADAEVDVSNVTFGDLASVGRQLGLELPITPRDLTAAQKENLDIVQRLIEAYGGLEAAADQSTDKQISALIRLKDSFTAAAQASGQISIAEDQRLDVIRDLITQLLRKKELERETPEAARETDANAKIRERIARLNEENEIARAILQHGADSTQVAELRADAERRALQEVLDSSGASEDLKEELLRAFENGQLLADLDMSKGIAGASAFALDLAERLGISLDLAQQLQGAARQIQAETTPLGLNPIQIPTGLGHGVTKSTIVNPPKKPRRKPGGRRTVSDAEREQQALDRLIASKQRELEILRETDPVQQQMIRLRDRLKGATDTERKKVEELIGAIEQERIAKERRDDFETSLEAVLRDARSLKDIWGGIGDAILDAARNALLLGEGPLSGLVGGIFGGLDGGLIGGISDAVGPIFGFAGGGVPSEAQSGLILGTGTGSSDSMLARVSAGEMIINQQATQRNRTLLEAINAGAVIPGFAAGGLPLPANSPAQPGGGIGAGPRGQGSLLIRIAPSDLFEATIADKATDAAVSVVRDFETNDLPRAVNRINDDPRRVG